MRVPWRPRPVALLLVANLLAGAGLAWQGTAREAEWVPPPPVEPALPAVPEFGVAAAPPAAAILERPLFWASRRPIADAPAEGPEAADSALEDVRILGLLDSGEEGALLYRAGEDAAVARLQVGQTLRGWRLTGMAADGAVFRRGDEERLLTLPRPRFEGGSLRPAR